MYNWVTVRKLPRTEGPTYPARAAQTVDAVVAKWIPATAALLACFVTPASAKLDSRYYESPNYPVRAAQTVDATVRTWIPTFDTEAQSYRVDARPPLDVRRYEWAPEFVSIPRLIDPTIAKWQPAFSTEVSSEFVRSRPSLDVRAYDWLVDEGAWIKATLPSPGPTVAQTAPAWTSEAQSFRTADGPDLDLFRTTSRPSAFGIPEDWATWTPTFAHGERTISRALLDVRAYEWSQPAWIVSSLSIPPPTTAQIWPALLEASGLSYRTSERARLDVRAFDWLPEPAWIFTSLPPAVTVAQTWPAILEGLSPSYCTIARPALDLRAYDWSPAFTWVQPVVDASVRSWLPIFDAELASTRIPARRQDPIITEPQPAWIFSSLPAAVTTAQAWPAILQGLSPSYRTGERARLDVRLYEWSPSFGWMPKAVDIVVAKWAPVFDAEVGYRTDGRRLYDVRPDTSAPELAWLAPVVTFPPTIFVNTGMHATSRGTVRMTSGGPTRTTWPGLHRGTNSDENVS